MHTRLVTLGIGAIATMAAVPAHADVVIGPRVSYYFDNSNLRTSGFDTGLEEGDSLDPQDAAVIAAAFGETPTLSTRLESEGVKADQIGFAMYGGMVNFGGDRDRFTLTAMYGSGEGSLAQSAAVSRNLAIGPAQITDLINFDASAIDSSNRLDIEATWQRRQSETFAILAGLRYERIDSTYTGNLRVVQGNAIATLVAQAEAIVDGNPVPPILPAIPAIDAVVREETRFETFSARAGVTAFVPFSQSAVAFFNGMLQASYRPDNSYTLMIDDPSGVFDGTTTGTEPGEVSLGPDFAVGAQFILAKNIALDLRYRAVLFFPLSGAQTFSDARVNHGVNLGLSLRL